MIPKLPEHLNKHNLANLLHYGDQWSKGIEAEILEPQLGDWKKGKIRVRVIFEFCPDEPEIDTNQSQNNGSLDDIRQTIL